MQNLRMPNWDALLSGSGENFDHARESVTIADCRQPDMPLVYIGKGFEKMTGYSVAEALGKNCRFLQGPDTDKAAVDIMRRNIKMRSPCLVEFVNYRKNGRKFWNRLSLSPIFDKKNEAIFYIGLQNDVDQMKTFEARLLSYIGRLD